MSLAQDKEAPEFLAAGSPPKTTLTFNFSEKEPITSKIPSINELSARITSKNKKAKQTKNKKIKIKM